MSRNYMKQCVSALEYARGADGENALDRQMKLSARRSSAPREAEETVLGRIREIFAAGDLPFRAWNPRRAQLSALLSVSTV